MSGASRPDSKSARNVLQGTGLGMSYLLNLGISEIVGFEKCKLIVRLTNSCVFGPDKWGGVTEKSYGLGSGANRPKNHMVWGVGPEGRKIIWSGEWGRKAEKSYGLGSGPAVQKQMNKSKTKKTPR